MHVVFVALFVFLSLDKCISENAYSERSRYNLNHPPLPEVDNPTPVTLFHDDDVSPGKTINPEIDISPNIENVMTTIENQDITTEPIENDIEVKKSATTSKPYQPEKLKSGATKELQIPVEIIYDSEPVRYRKPEQSAPVIVVKPTVRKAKQTRRRTLQKKISTESETSSSQKTEIESQRTDVSDYTQNEKSKSTESKSDDVIKPRLGSIDSSQQSSQPMEVLTKTRKNRKRDPVVPIVEEANYVFAHNGNFHYSYEGGDGTKAHSEGQLRSFGDQSAGESVSGGFSYTDKEGNDFSLSYTADENGYRPVGAHLPTPPPIPPAIARALAYLATATSPEPVTKPSVKKP